MTPEPHGFLDPYFATAISIGEIAVRLGLALVLGGLIGFEREARNRAAGLRTHMLVALAAATFTVVTIELALYAVELDDNIRTDPVRLIQAVVAGVAFLGAGAIIQSQRRIQGLTTGAGIWIAGAVGVSCGAGFYAIAGIAAALALIVLSAVGYLERRVKDKISSGPDRGTGPDE